MDRVHRGPVGARDWIRLKVVNYWCEFSTFISEGLPWNVVLRLRNASRAKDIVSSRDFLHRLTAPTFPPVRCSTEYSFDDANRVSTSVGGDAEPLSNFRVRAVNAEC